MRTTLDILYSMAQLDIPISERPYNNIWLRYEQEYKLAYQLEYYEEQIKDTKKDNLEWQDWYNLTKSKYYDLTEA